MLAKGLSVFLVTVLAVLPSARAADRESREREAKRACLNGEVDAGVKILTDLYVDTNDPTYIFNQGRCYEQSSRYEQAIGRFREYLRKARSTPDDDRADVEKHIADCQSLLQKERDRSDQDRPGPSTLPPPPIPPAAPAQPDSTQLTQQAGTQGTAGRGLRIGGVVLGLTGAAALVAGVALNLKYNGTTRDLEGNYSEGTDSSSHTYKRLSQIGYAAGAAGMAAGAVMYYVGWRAGRMTIVPATVAGGDGLVLTGAF